MVLVAAAGWAAEGEGGREAANLRSASIASSSVRPGSSGSSPDTKASTADCQAQWLFIPAHSQVGGRARAGGSAGCSSFSSCSPHVFRSRAAGGAGRVPYSQSGTFWLISVMLP